MALVLVALAMRVHVMDDVKDFEQQLRVQASHRSNGYESGTTQPDSYSTRRTSSSNIRTHIVKPATLLRTFVVPLGATST